jgi:hypothetical protein
MSVFLRGRRCAFLLAFITSAAGAVAQSEQKQGPATLRIRGDKEEDGRIELRLSSLLSVTFSLEGPATLEVEDAKPAEITNSPFWTVRKADEPEIAPLPGNRMRWQRTCTLDPQNKGDLPLQIGPLRYRVEAGKGEWQKIEWKPVVIHVTTTVPRADVSQLRDIPGPEPIPEARSPWIPVLRWSGAALMLLAAIMFILQRRRHARPTPQLPPHEWAARELERLEKMDLPRHGQAERFHTLVSDTIRRYLELRFQLRAPRQTTAEFLEAMRESPHLTTEQRTLLRDFLERCDLAKFARAEYSDEECRVTTEMARTFVEQTKPAPAPVPGATRMAPTEVSKEEKE